MKKIKKKVLIAGTFDILHPGHVFLINEAAKLGDVYVVVATDKNREFYSGKAPVVPEKQRLELIKSIKNIKEAKLGRPDNDTLKTVEEINPDIILLGPDQLGPDQNLSLEKLKNALNMKGMNKIDVRRLEKYYDKFELHSSSLIKRKIIETYKKK